MLAARIEIASFFYSFDIGNKNNSTLEIYFKEFRCHQNFNNINKKMKVLAHLVNPTEDKELNKLVKSFLVSGIPTQEIWRRVCRKVTDLKDFNSDALSKTSVTGMKILSQ